MRLQLGVEIRRSCHQLLRFGGDLRSGIGAVRFKLIRPLADCSPLIVLALYGRISPHHGHARGQRLPGGVACTFSQIERRHVFDLPAQMVVRCFDGLDGCVAAPRIGIVAARRQRQLKRLIHQRNGA